MARQRSVQKAGRRRGRSAAAAKSNYFVQPGKRGAVVVLRKPAGNRIMPKVCGVMPSQQHAKMLIEQLQKAESVVGDLFLEATDDGIEALEAVLAACRDDVLRRLPVRNERGERGERNGRGPRPGGRPGGAESEPDAALPNESVETEATPYAALPNDSGEAPNESVAEKPAPRKRRSPRKKE